MSFSRTDNGRKVWICRQTKELIKAFGGQECTASFLDLGLTTVKKWPDVNEAGNITLMSLVKLEEELVSIGSDPVFTLEHLRTLGYIATKLDAKTSKTPAACALDMVQAACDAIKAASEAAADWEITPAEHRRIVGMFEGAQKEYAKYLSSYKASISDDAKAE
ncbi:MULTISPECIES: hypothetical protein [unclassified Pseudovibrio]|uniref:hypothetical protein n=1 Tax=unclassified Pseudovibrio TaxID=2627060 RepID=UPI0007AE5184|nr:MULTISPECIES: hypothetical protein [unclassified Pseudovibrio]KZL01584.1 hypothetical protein PsAD5_00506 [Pseudovibrio sp. Ad5]KZL02806.1 hypothetical protein PsW74_01000 [Pseudovibrio sp. W74]KZL07509.1 hypothetical protein PsAD14_03895 [Pseudovibrio sp. Ad14]